MTRKGQPVDVAPGNGIQVKIPNMQGKEKSFGCADYESLSVNKTKAV